MIGPGKYDLECTLLREGMPAEGVLMAVINGPHGSGFSLQAPPYVVAQLPKVLREIADQIESQKEMGGN